MRGRPIPAGEFERAYGRAAQLRAEAERKERAVCRKVATLAAALGGLMGPGMWLHRRGVALHAFDVDGSTCLASSYLEEVGDDYLYRYAVLCGGLAAKAALRDAPLDPAAADEPGVSRRIALATYADCLDFLDRLPIYLADLTREYERRTARADCATAEASRASVRLSAVKQTRAHR